MILKGVQLVLYLVYIFVKETNANDLFKCDEEQVFCRWTREESTDWMTAYNDCTRSGGSLASRKHYAYIEEWITLSQLNASAVWSSLHRVNYRFQWLYQKPEYLPTYLSEWRIGHPAPRKECVIVSPNSMYESVDCGERFPAICVVERNRKARLLTDLAPPESQVLVHLTASNYESKTPVHVTVSRNDTTLRLNCNASSNGGRILEYSWLKDGVYLGNNRSVLMPSMVLDESKITSDSAEYQKQGTYKCQVREFGSLKSFISNPILVTFKRILNGILRIVWPAGVGNSSHLHEVMKEIILFINHKILKEEFKFSERDFHTSWDPLYYVEGDETVEHRISLYVDIANDYPDSTLYHILSDITKKMSSPKLHRLWGFEWADVTWANYCPARTEQSPLLSEIHPHPLAWPASWSDSDSIIFPLEEVKILCIHRDNRAEVPLGRKCLPDFVRGAELTPLNFMKCRQLIAPESVARPCRYGYELMSDLNICFKITEPGTWEEAISPCVNDWPRDEPGSFDFDLAGVVRQLRSEGKVSALWLPVRSASDFSPLFFHSTSFNDSGVHDRRGMNVTWNYSLEDGTCLQLSRDGVFEGRTCSDSSALPGICAYRARNATQENKRVGENLCPDPWRGYVIHQGRLVCFQLVETTTMMTWHEAEELCHQQHLGFSANVSLITLEDPLKAELWNRVRLEWTTNITSAWIGLHWSEENRKYCWKATQNCSFQHFNWDPLIKWDETKLNYGVIGHDGVWSLVTDSAVRNQVVCQTSFDLALDQKITLRRSGDSALSLDVIQNDRQMSYPTRTYANLSEFLALGERSWSNLPATHVIGVDIHCYVDGQLFKNIRSLPAELPINAEMASAYQCNGWMGWSPRRFIRSETILVQPSDALVYVAIIEMTNGSRMIDFKLDLYRRMDEFERLAIIANIHHEKQSGYHCVVRIVLKGKGLKSRREHDWLDFLHYFFRLPTPSYSVVDIRSTIACPEESENAPNRKPVSMDSPKESDNLCIAEDGTPVLLRQCIGNPVTGFYWQSITDLNGRTCRPSTELFSVLRQLTSQVLSNETNPSSALDQLNTLSGQWEQPNAVELYEAAKLLQVSVQHIGQPSQKQFHSASEIMATMSSSPAQLARARAIPGFSKQIVTTLEQLMGTVDLSVDDSVFRHPKMLADSMLVRSMDVLGYGGNLAADGLLLNGSKILSNASKDDLASKDVLVLLPMEEIRLREGRDDVRLSFSIFANADLIDARSVTKLDGDEFDYVVESPVIVAQVGDHSLSNLTKSVRILFRARSNSSRPVCVYWDKSTNFNSGGWSTAGCRYAGKTEELHICECNHLTPLALLIPYSDRDMHPAHVVALGVISVTGCALSIAALLVVILTFLIFSTWRRSLGNKILFNLCLALFGLLASFLSLNFVTLDHPFCKVVAVSIHYFLLASFAWMLVEAVYQYVMYVVVVGATAYKSCFIRKAAPLAWGVPVVPVIGLLVYNPAMYVGQAGICWMGVDAFYPSVLGPVLTVLLVNVSIFAIIVKKVVCARQKGLRSSQPTKLRKWYQFRMAVCVFFLLGLTWIFGFASIGDSSLAFAYLFCVFNSLQGFSLFVFFVLREKNARRLWSEFVGSEDKSSLQQSNLSGRHSDYSAKRISKFY